MQRLIALSIAVIAASVMAACALDHATSDDEKERFVQEAVAAGVPADEAAASYDEIVDHAAEDEDAFNFANVTGPAG